MSDRPRGDNEVKQEIARKIGDVFDAAVNRKHGENAGMNESYATIGDVEADRIQIATGLNVHGYSHSISRHEILHALGRHGKGSGDPRPITKEDFAKLHEIIITADEIIHDGPTHIGLPAITYKKRINGYTVIVEEMRGKKTQAVGLQDNV